MPKKQKPIEQQYLCPKCKNPVDYWRGWDIYLPCHICDRKSWEQWQERIRQRPIGDSRKGDSPLVHLQLYSHPERIREVPETP